LRGEMASALNRRTQINISKLYYLDREPHDFFNSNRCQIFLLVYFNSVVVAFLPFDFLQL
jgi:hypothetical protein